MVWFRSQWTSWTRGRFAAVVGLVLLVPAVAVAGRLFATRTHCASIPAGVATDEQTGSSLAVGIPFVGTAASASTVMRVGAVPCLGGLSLGVLPGDCNGDQAITLEDYQCFESCLSGPEFGVGRGCDLYDLNTDGHVSHTDYAHFQRLFGSSIGR